MVLAHLTVDPVWPVLVRLDVLDHRVTIDAQLIVFILQETLLVEISEHVEGSQVLDLLIQVSNAVLGDPIVRATDMRQPVVAREHMNLEPHIVAIPLVAKDANVRFLHIDAKEPALWISL